MRPQVCGETTLVRNGIELFFRRRRRRRRKISLNYPKARKPLLKRKRAIPLYSYDHSLQYL
jgi:hypothetical protein